MADPKKPTVATGPLGSPKPPAPPTAPTAPAAPAPEPKKKRERKVWKEVFDTPEAALAEANGRDKGPRRAFTVKHGDKEFHVVAHNEGRAAGIGFLQIGGTVEELGRSKKSKMPTAEGIAASLGAMSPEALKLIEEALAKVKGNK